MTRRLLMAVFMLFPLTLFRFDLLSALNEQQETIRKILQEDVDGDKNKEYIIGFQTISLKGNAPYAGVRICKFIKQINRQKLQLQQEIVTGNYLKGIKSQDITGDSIKDLIIESGTGRYWNNLCVISFKDGKYVKLWDSSTSSGVVFKINENGFAQVTIGIPVTIQKQGDDYDKSKRSIDWQVWIWDGKKFAYTASKNQ